MSRLPQREGFTLFECVLAVAVFSIAAIGIVAAVQAAGNATWDTQRAELASEEIRSVVEEVIGSRQPDGTFTIETPSGSQVEVTVEEAELVNRDEIILTGIKRITITIQRPGLPSETLQVLSHASR